MAGKPQIVKREDWLELNSVTLSVTILYHCRHIIESVLKNSEVALTLKIF